LPGEKRTEGGGYAYHSSALATALVRRSGCSPAEPYPPFQLGDYIILRLNFACNQYMLKNSERRSNGHFHRWIVDFLTRESADILIRY
jgi:hypothetical protein